MSTPKRTFLVCGGAGFIGSHFARRMLREHTTVRVIVLDKLTYAGTKKNIADLFNSPRFVFAKGDIADAKTVARVFKKYRPEYIINFAAETHVDRSIHGHADDFVHTNVKGVFALLEAVRAHHFVKKYVQVSTDEVYGDVEVTSKQRFNESALLRPSSPYSSTKAAGDLLCMSYVRTYQVPVVITRGSNTYGASQYPEKLIPFFALRASQGKALPLYGDGKNTRDWLYVEDHCRAIELCLMKGKAGEIYNISAEEYHTNLDIATRIVKYFGKTKSAIEFVADRPGHDRKYVPDSTKLREELGWKPKAVFSQAFQETIEWYKENLK